MSAACAAIEQPRTRWAGGCPFLQLPQEQPCEEPEFDMVAAICANPGLLTADLSRISERTRGNVVRILTREERNGRVHAQYVTSNSRRQLAWFPGARGAH